MNRNLEQYFKIYNQYSYNNVYYTDNPDDKEDGPDEKETVYVDVQFLLDGTSSMGPYIMDMKNEINNMIKILKEDTKKNYKEITKKELRDEYLKYRVGIVVYRDFKDKKQFEKYDFTENIDNIVGFLNKIKANGGDDTPENILGAFIEGLNLNDESKNIMNWSKNKDTIRHMILISDSPPHGKFFNKMTLGDNFPDIDLYEWKYVIDQLKNMNIHLHIIKITSYLENTCKYFLENYQETSIINMTQNYINRECNDYSLTPVFGFHRTDESATVTPLASPTLVPTASMAITLTPSLSQGTATAIKRKYGE
jgi:hypothetical protein